MIQAFVLHTDQLRSANGNCKQANVFIMSSPKKVELQRLCQQFDLDPVIFNECNSAEEVSRFHEVTSTVLKQLQLLVVFDFNVHYSEITDQLTPTILLFNADYLFLCTKNAANALDELTVAVKGHPQIPALVAHLINFWQGHLIQALDSYEEQINYLNKAAQKAIKDHELRQLTSLMRRLVFLEHTINDQSETITAFEKSAIAQTVNSQMLLDIKTNQRRLAKAIHIYRDVLESLNGLYMGIMDNNLNHLMKFLDSAGLILATASLLSGFMGMNVGGMPWKSSAYGFWIILGIALLVAVVISIYLRRKSYTD